MGTCTSFKLVEEGGQLLRDTDESRVEKVHLSGR